MIICALAIRNLGIPLFLCLILMIGNLHGCAQYYGHRTQVAWLGQVSSSIHQTEPLAGHHHGGELYAGNVVTRVSGYLESPGIGELSGLAVSRVNSEVFWAINDSDNMPELFAIKRNGKHLASLNLPLRNNDWEDMTSFKDNGLSWLLIADTGDNLRNNKESTLYFLAEPVLPQSSQHISTHRKVVFQYEDGPQNVESIAVSVKERLIFLVAKNSGLPKIYTIALDIANTLVGAPVTNPDKPVVAKLAGRLKPLCWTKDDRWLEKILASRILLGATSMDISADDSLAVIANYRHAYLYRRKPGQSWLQAFMLSPQIITAHRLAQSESVAFSDDAHSILIGSEGRYAPLLWLKTEFEANL